MRCPTFELLFDFDAKNLSNQTKNIGGKPLKTLDCFVYFDFVQ